MADTYSAACTDTTFGLFQKWLEMCGATGGEFARLVRDRARDRHWTAAELDSCLSWLAREDRDAPMPYQLIATVLDEMTVASREAAAATRRLVLLHQMGSELTKAAFREHEDARVDLLHMIPEQRPKIPPAQTGQRIFSGIGPTLTPREREILQLLGTGQSNRQISRRLGLAERTVKNHLSSLFSKLEATDRTTAVLAALRHGLISVTPGGS